MQTNHQILTQVTSLPTAPFAESHVIRWIEHFVSKRPNLKLTADAFGNLLISLKTQAKPATPRLVYTAHMDHPGLIARKMLTPTTLEADFRGGVRTEFVQGAKVHFISESGQEIAGKILTATSTDDARSAYPTRCTVKVKSPVPAGVPGMFALGPGRVKGKKFLSRALDDLAGLAAALAMLDKLHKSPPKTPIAVLCTRAEEEGFIGAIAASLRPTLLRKTDRLIAIECSAAQPYAPQGKGVIIRVGDRTSVFNSALTYFLTTQAEALARKNKSFLHQRALMPGGTCEATVYDLYGFCAAAVCIPLANYHNMNRETMTLKPEEIHLADWDNMVALFLQIAKSAHEFNPANPALKSRIEARFNKLKFLF